jgi:2-dehydropantoate 2-reductase
VTRMRLLCLGAGAIGGYVGGSLAAAGHAVTFLARGAAREALASRGLNLTPLPGAAPLALPVGVVAELPQADGLAAFDLLLLAVKAHATAALIAQVLAVTRTPPPIVCLQNGVDGEAELAAAFGPERVIAATVTSPVSVGAPGVVVVEKARGLGLALGLPQAEALAAALNVAGLRTRLYASAGALKWSKLLTNLLGNATAAITGLDAGRIFAHPGLFALEAASIRECLRVMRSYGYPLVDLPGVPVRLLAWAVTGLPAALARPLLARLVGGGRGGKRPSLHLDLLAGRTQTEAPWLHGAVARHAAQRGLEAPVNALLAETVESLANGPLERERFAGRPEALTAWVDERSGRRTKPIAPPPVV